MKRNLVLTAVFALFVFALSASAQKTTDFSGKWTLDVSKSNPAETRIESQTLTVTQTADSIKVEQDTKVKEDPNAAGGGGGGRPGGGGMGGPATYGITAPIKSTRQMGQNSVDVSSSAKIDGNKATLSTTFTTPQGDRTQTTTWTLNTDGTLTVESQGRNGSQTRTYKKG
ncbi:MAG: hypothetical protein JO314_05190 [Acidobacteria bacterium]|nr:hypothetical protein [Acidobacteriota bacterium]